MEGASNIAVGAGEGESGDLLVVPNEWEEWRRDCGLGEIDDRVPFPRRADIDGEIGGFVKIDVTVRDEISNTTKEISNTIKEVAEASSSTTGLSHSSRLEINIVGTCNLGP